MAKGSSSDSSDSGASVIHIEGAHVRFGTTTVLALDQLIVKPGERIFVLGRSGSGKTTLSRLVKGRLKAA